METHMKQRIQNRIIEAAIVKLASKPVSTLDEIAKAADVGRATLYRYFDSRTALIKAMIKYADQKMDEAICSIFTSKMPAEQKLDELVRALIPLGASLHFTVYAPIHGNDPEVTKGHKKFLDWFKGLCQELKDEGVAAQDIPVAWVVANLDMIIFTAWEKIKSGDIAANDAPNLVLRTFLNGIGTAGSQQ
jgi:AcrR family transcriptional regulator